MREFAVELFNGEHLLHRLRLILRKGHHRLITQGFFTHERIGNLAVPLLHQISGYGEVTLEVLQAGLGDVGILHRQRAANTTAVAGIELNEFQIGNMFILDLVQHLDHILDAVGRKIAVIKECSGFTARSRPGNTDKTGLRGNGGIGNIPHFGNETEVNVTHGQNSVHGTAILRLGVFYVADLCGARRNKEAAHAIGRNIGIFLPCLLLGKSCGHFHRRQKGQHVLAKRRKANADDAAHSRTGRTDDGLFDILAPQVVPGIAGDQLRSPCHLEHAVKAHSQKAFENDIRIVQSVKLPVQSGSR